MLLYYGTVKETNTSTPRSADDQFKQSNYFLTLMFECMFEPGPNN